LLPVATPKPAALSFENQALKPEPSDGHCVTAAHQRVEHAIAEALRLLDQPEGAIPPGRWLLARLLGSATAHRFADGLNAGERSPIELMGLESYGAWEAFTTELLTRLRSDPASQSGFWRELASVVERSTVEPDHWAMMSARKVVRAAVETYRETPSASEAWETMLDSYVLYEDGFLFTLARDLDPERFLSHLGQLPHPVFVAQSINDRSDDLPALIRAAPLAFNETGTFQREGMVLLALLQACAAECRRRAWGDRDVPQPVDPEHLATLDPVRAEVEVFADLFEVHALQFAREGSGRRQHGEPARR
jgi:hypothetical protein